MSTRVTLVNGSGDELGTAADPVNIEGTVTASFSPSGTQDVNITQVGGNAVTTTVPVSGTVTATATNLDIRDLTSVSDSVEVKQATGTNLHTVVDSGTITTVSAVTAISNALPAGTNNIGDVDVASIAAGDNNIGNVDIVTMPNVVIGSGTITTITNPVAVTQSGTWDEVGINDSGNVITTDGSGTAGTPAGGVLTIQGVTSMTPIQVGDNSSSLTVDYATTGSGTATGALRVELPTNGTGVIATVGAVTAITNALPAGTNNIGDVDVLSIAAGNNNIGDVDIASIASGDNNIGNVDIVSGTITTVTTVSTVTALGAGTTGPMKAEDVAHATGDQGFPAWGVRNDTTSQTTFGADLDYCPMAVDLKGNSMTVGNLAHDQADAQNPVKIGFKSYSPDGTTPGTAVAELDRTDAKADLDGRQFVNGEHPRWWSYHEDSSNALTDASVQADPGDGFQIVITEIFFSTGAATACNIFFEEGASKVLGPWYLEAVAGRGLFWKGAKHVTASTALTVTTSAAIAHGLDIQGYIQAV